MEDSMYSINLVKITIDEFERAMLTSQLLPSERGILNNLSLNLQKIKNNGLTNLLELQNLLKKKKDYDSIAKDLGIDKDYLKILNRMVNSYVVKTEKLEKLEIFTCEELTLLGSENIKNTECFYETFKNIEQINDVSNRLCIPGDKLKYALHIIDLLRINGVGVEYAKALYAVEIKSVDDYNRMPSETILNSIREYNKEKIHSKATLGIADIDYCRRFCEKLDCNFKRD